MAFKKREVKEGHQTILKAYKYEVLPNKAQKKGLAQHMGGRRKMWNDMLHILNEEYEDYKIKKEVDEGTPYPNLSSSHLRERLSKLKQTYDWGKDVDSKIIAYIAKDLSKAFSGIGKNGKKPPKFKKKYKSRESYTTYNNEPSKPCIKLYENSLKVPILGKLKIIKHRNIGGRIINATFSKESNGKYYVSLLCEIHTTDPKKTGNETGIDLGLKDNNTITTDRGEVYKGLTEFKKLEKKKKRLSRALSKKQKGSENWKKQKEKLAKLEFTIRKKREHIIHNMTRKLVNENDVIMMEDLNVKGMMKNRRLSKSLANASFHTVKTCIEYKMSNKGGHVSKVDRFFPSSKLCSNCGHKNNDLKLTDRRWTCKSCGTTHDRDVNAATNIKEEGRRLITEVL